MPPVEEKKLSIEVIRSHRRKKTVQARMDGDRLIVYLPAGLNRKEEDQLIEEMKQKIEKRQLRKQLNDDIYLRNRADELNRRYFGNRLRISSIRYVTNQNKRSGSCTPVDGSIRISHKLAQMPEWVLDYVIMHEITHLVHPDHSRQFWEKVNEYKYAERARGFLICRGMEDAGRFED